MTNIIALIHSFIVTSMMTMPSLNISNTYPIQRYPPEKKHMSVPWHFIWNRRPYWYTDIIYKIIQNWRFLKACLSRYDVMTLWYYLWKHSQICCNKVYHLYIFMHKLQKSKSRKTKHTDLLCIKDKNHNDLKLCQKVIMLKV